MSIFLHHLSLCFCEREEKNRKEKRTRARHEREKINRREREKKQTNTNLASPRSRSRSPLAPPAKASECRLVFANPFFFFFLLLSSFFSSGSLYFSLSLSLSLSLSIQNYLLSETRASFYLCARVVYLMRAPFVVAALLFYCYQTLSVF